jgi:hypothetical protein
MEGRQGNAEVAMQILATLQRIEKLLEGQQIETVHLREAIWRCCGKCKFFNENLNVRTNEAETSAQDNEILDGSEGAIKH